MPQTNIQPIFEDSFPERVRVLVIGGGIHGVGILHDLASRGWRDVFLCEKNELGSGTSSKSTKLIHGGLRYLRNIADFGMVSEGLHERKTLIECAGDIVHPVEFLFPVMKHGGMSTWLVRAGLSLYDTLAGGSRLNKHRKVSVAEIREKAPYFDETLFKSCFSFWDGQTDDLELVRRVAFSAENLGAKISEKTTVLKIEKSADGWDVHVQRGDEKKVISALYIVNCAGPWAHEILKAANLEPEFDGMNIKGVHLVTPDIGMKAGMFLQSPEDRRIFFVLPWNGCTLIGTTESDFKEKPDSLSVESEDVNYLLEKTNRYLKTKISERDVRTTFAGLRWLAVEKGKNISQTSRSYEISQHEGERGMCYTIYGGKLTGYRALSEDLGDLLCKHYGQFKPSCTKDPASWVKSHEPKSPSVLKRFEPHG